MLPDNMLPGNMLLATFVLLPSTLLVYRQQNCCQFVAPLLLDTKGYKSTVTEMNSNYVAEIQSTCIPKEQLVAGQHVAVNIYDDGNMLLVRAKLGRYDVGLLNCR